MAVGAALTASAVGGLLGAVVLFLRLPVLRPIMPSVESPETLLPVAIGLDFIATLAGRQALPGLFAGVPGIALPFAGDEPVGGVLRYSIGFDYLVSGFDFIPLALGIFAVPEILFLMTGGVDPRRLNARPTFGEIPSGMRAVLVRPVLTIAGSRIGAITGIIPGVGGETATRSCSASCWARRWSAISPSLATSTTGPSRADRAP